MWEMAHETIAVLRDGYKRRTIAFRFLVASVTLVNLAIAAVVWLDILNNPKQEPVRGGLVSPEYSDPLAEILHQKGLDCCLRPDTPIAGIGQSQTVAQKVLKQLSNVPAYYKAPPSIELDKSAQLKLAVASNSEFFRKDPDIYSSQSVVLTLSVSRKMSAQLTGPPSDVTVSLRDPEAQDLNPIRENTWTWDVTPKVLEPIKLRLQVFAWVELGDVNQMRSDSHEISIEVADITIPVRVTLWKRVKLYAAEIEPTWALLVSVAAGIAALLAWLGLKPRTKGPDFS